MPQGITSQSFFNLG